MFADMLCFPVSLHQHHPSLSISDSLLSVLVTSSTSVYFPLLPPTISHCFTTGWKPTVPQILPNIDSLLVPALNSQNITQQLFFWAMYDLFFFVFFHHYFCLLLVQCNRWSRLSVSFRADYNYSASNWMDRPVVSEQDMMYMANSCCCLPSVHETLDPRVPGTNPWTDRGY